MKNRTIYFRFIKLIFILFISFGQSLADDVVINGAELKDGMLVIDLEKIVPEEKKPRTIKIK